MAEVVDSYTDKDGLALLEIQQAVLDHIVGALEDLLRGLEHQLHRAGELRLVVLQ